MRLDISFLVGVWLEALVYGVYVVAFIVCLHFIRTRAPSVGRALPIWLVALFILATAHCALSLSALLDAFVRHTYPMLHGAPPYPYPSAPPSPSASAWPNSQTGPPPGPSVPQHFYDPSAYISNRALPTNLATLGVYAGIVLVSDLMMLYRLLVMYKYRFIWAVLPGLLSIASFAVSMVVVSKYAHVDLTASDTVVDQQLSKIDPWVPPVYAISFLANLSLTALMMVKASFASKPNIRLDQSLPAFAARRRHTRQTSLTAGDGFVFDIDERTGPVPGPGATSSSTRTRSISSGWVMVAGVVEAGAIMPVFMLAALILYVAQSGQESLIVPLLAPLAALVPTLQIIQIQLGLDSTASSRPNSYHTAVSSTLNEHGNVIGRSPYLVPAPRYRDSFSSDEEDKDDGRFAGAPPRRSSASRSRSGSGSGSAPGGAGGDPVSPTSARRFSAQIASMWAWRGRTSGSGSGSGPGAPTHSRTVSHSHTHSNSQSGSSGRAEPVHLQMRDLTGLGGRVALDAKPAPQGEDGDVWERIKLDEAPNSNSNPGPGFTPIRTSDPPPPPRRSALRKNSVAKEMISKPVPVAADFPPSTATIPSTAIVPALPSFTLTPSAPNSNLNPNQVQLKKTPSMSLRGEVGNGGAGVEHKYHYRMRPREKTASPLAAYLSAQALSQHQSPLSQRESLSRELPLSQAPQGPQPGLAPPGPSSSNGPPSSNGHGMLSLPSTTPTSPASGFTSLGPASAIRNPFRYDGPPQGQGQGQGQVGQGQGQGQGGHRRSYSDVQRAAANVEGRGGESGGMAGVGLSGAHRSPLTFPHHPQPQPQTQYAFTANPEADQVQRWAAPPGAPFISGLDTFFPPNRSGFGGVGMEIERDVSPAPGLQRDYARAREEVLRQMNRERGGGGRGAMSDDESVYSAQVGGPGWRAFQGR